MSMSVYAVTFDCTNAAVLVRFWSAVLERPVDSDPSEDFAALGPGGDPPTEPRWMFIKVAEPKRTKNRVHVDFVSDDWKAQVDRVIALGAIRIADFDEDGSTWTTLADPEGNEFDIAATPQ
jgi:hypothetical protein